MIRALWSAASGMGAQQLKVDVTANNISNVNTPGFKASRVEFQDVFYTFLRPPDDPDLLLQVGHGAMPAATVRQLTQGILEQTGDQLHLSIEGSGFFQIQNDDTGAMQYTRDGTFRLDADGRIVTADGRPLLTSSGVVTVPDNAVEVQIASDGRITAYLADDAPRDLGRLQLAIFPNATGLQALGHNAYVATAASGPAVIHWPGTAGTGQVRQGFVERSNVELIEEMVGLMTAQRAYELNSKVVHAADEMMGLANNLRR